tara:strand:+ start:215 stop:958 length:744 start_codon:yes stop_codon:yes gene_type:complete
MDLVSVIIPYFKKKKFISKAIKSALNQKYRFIEIILVYDNYDDEDLKIIETLAQNDNRVKIIKNVKNLGAGYSRNKGIKKASGKYIAFLDADDVWDTTKISKQLEYMQKNSLKISHTSYKIINEEDTPVGNRVARDFTELDQLLKSCDIGLSTVMAQKEIFSDELFFPNLKTKEDFVLWLRILQKDIKIGALNEELTHWRKTPDALSGSTIQKLIDGFRVYNQYMRFNIIKSLFYLFYLSFNYLKKR